MIRITTNTIATTTPTIHQTIAMDIYFIFMAVKLPPPEPKTSDIGPIAGGIGGVVLV
jgi:hypothetical protein